MSLYTRATSSLQINDCLSDPIGINSFIRQGRPLSMQLYAFCVNPLINALNSTLTGISLGRGTDKIGVAAYADDVTIFRTSVTDIPKIQEVLLTLERASGAKINKLKSQALALGSWYRTVNIFAIPYADHLSILAQRIATTVRHILSPPEDCISQRNTISARFVWRGEIFRVPMSTLHRPNVERGWNLIHVQAKCRTLLLNRTQHLLANNKSTPHTWLAEWQINGTGNNPPNIAHLPNEIEYIRQYISDVAYVGQQTERIADRI
jgi:hypothetical protein